MLGKYKILENNFGIENSLWVEIMVRIRILKHLNKVIEIQKIKIDKAL